MARGNGTDHYRVLGVPPSASAAEIRRAYLHNARLHHPDRHVDSPPPVRAEHDRTMRHVNAAWAVLGDPAARRRYDEACAAASAADTPRDAARGSTTREDRWAEEDAARAAWRPFDEGPDVVDPRLAADEPAPDPPRPPRSSLGSAWRLVVGAGMGFLLGGALSGVATLAGAGIVLFVVGGALFLAAPLLALGKSVRNDRR